MRNYIFLQRLIACDAGNDDTKIYYFPRSLRYLLDLLQQFSLCKNFIYRQKLFYAGNLDLLHFLRELQVKLGIEKFICTEENKSRKFGRLKKIYEALR